jgi:hypothetical protein
VRVDGIAVGKDRVNAVIRRRAGSYLAEVWRSSGDAGHPIDVTFAPALPLGATGVVTMAAAPDTLRYPGAMVVPQTTRMRERVRMGINWTGGWESVALEPAARIGDRSTALRVLSERMSDGRFVVTLQGRARHSYLLRLRGPAAISAVTVEPSEVVMPGLQLGDRDPAGWQVLRLTMPATGGDSDEYVTLRLVMGT